MDLEWIEDILGSGDIPRRAFKRKDDFEEYSDDEFRRRYRLRKETVRHLLHKINDKLESPSNRNSPIPASLQLLSTLRLLATGTYQQLSADTNLISQPSMSRTFHKVIDAICDLRGEYIRIPQDLTPVKLTFLNYGGFPGVIGCIDGTHIPIVKPRNHPQPEIFRCRKGFFSINVQILCGPDHSIYNVVARWPGSTHDSRIFSNSVLKCRLENNEIRGTILADSGYPCLRYMMTPLRSPNSAAERAYNRAQIKTRNVVERTIGILKNRFRCLVNTMQYQPETIGQMIVACVILHNLAITFNEELDYIPDPHPVANVIMNNINPAGNAARQHLINNYFLNA
jgi:hypothetical protein